MPKNLRHLFFALAGGGALLSGLVLLLVQLLTPAQGGAFWARSILAILATVISAIALSVLWLTRMRGSLVMLQETLKQYGAGRFGDSERIARPEELSELSRTVRELGLKLEHQRNACQAQQREVARTVRDEALERMGRGILQKTEKSVASILGFLDLSLQQPLSEGPLQNYLRLAEREARDFLAWLSWLHKFLRPAAESAASCPINEILRRTASEFAAVASESGVTIRLNLADALPPVAGEETAVARVASVLIENAREALAGRGGILEINTNRDGRGRVVASFRDNGPGFDEEAARAMFSPFFSTKENRPGLNLALAAVTARLFGGRLDCWSQPGQGATFYLTLLVAETKTSNPGTSAASA